MLVGEDRDAIRKLNEFETSSRVENAHRNRYANILSNEPTRVRLQAVGPGENDYINANRVSGHDGHPGYIATQAPLPDTTPHFWQMVYESVTPVIIMLTRQHEDDCHVTKSDCYWPPVGQNILFNDYLVLGISEHMDEEMGLIERRFHVGRVVDKRRKHARDLVDADSRMPRNNRLTSLAFSSSAQQQQQLAATIGGGDDSASGQAAIVSDNYHSSSWYTPARSRPGSATSPAGYAQSRSGGGGGGGLNANADDESQDLLKHLELIGPVLEVVQLQYIDWPDQDVPVSPATLLDLCRKVDMLSIAQWQRTNVHGPPIVHCSAGVGRTGTFIAIDRTLRRLTDTFTGPNGEASSSRNAVSVEEIRELVRLMKRERSKMVQTPEQYRFIYLAVLEGMKRWERGDGVFIQHGGGGGRDSGTDNNINNVQPQQDGGQKQNGHPTGSDKPSTEESSSG